MGRTQKRNHEHDFVNIGQLQYYLRFELDIDDYVNRSISELNFTVRTSNCFKKEGINNISDLLLKCEEDLIKIKNFGANSLNEVEKKIEELFNKLPIENINENRCKYRIPYRFQSNVTDIISGDFVFTNNIKLDNVEIDFLERYMTEINLIDCKMRLAAFEKDFTIINISQMLQNFTLETDKLVRLKKKFDEVITNLTANRLVQKVKPYIKNYNNDSLRSIIETNYPELKIGETEQFAKIVVNYNIEVREILKFLSWISFDLENDFEDFLNIVIDNSRRKYVIKKRAQGETLELVGDELGLTRERVRQIEKKVINKSIDWFRNYQLIEKIFAILNNEFLITYQDVLSLVGKNHLEFSYLFSKFVEILPEYTIIPINTAVVSNEKFKFEKVNKILNSLPECFKLSELELIMSSYTQDQIFIEAVKKYVELSYKKTGKVYHIKNLSYTDMYKRIMIKNYVGGLKVFDEQAMQTFRDKLYEEYGEIDFPENDRAISARIADICILCDRGTYKYMDNIVIDKGLKNDIYSYIFDSEWDIVLTSSVFKVFEDRLIKYSIDNHYFLHGIIKVLFRDEFYFNKDCIMKNKTDITISDEIINYITNYNYPINQNQIRKIFPGATDAIINRTVSQSELVNLFGKYIHISKLGLDNNLIQYIDNSIKDLVSDKKFHHAKDLYQNVEQLKPNLWKQIYVEYPFSAFSVAEVLFADKYKFERPFFSQLDVEINDKHELLRIEAEKKDKVLVNELHEMAKKYKLNFTSIFNIIEIMLETHFLIDKQTLIREELLKIADGSIDEIEKLIIPFVKQDGTSLIRFLPCIPSFPDIGYKWSEWLIYSFIQKYSFNLEVGISSNFYSKAYPIISLKNKLDCNKYADIQLEDNEVEIHDMRNIDDFLDELIENEF